MPARWSRQEIRTIESTIGADTVETHIIGDICNSGEVLADQAGTGDVLSFEFAEPVHNAWIRAPQESATF
jgi:hypothetical protein